jgi:hypothetical protein
MAKQNQPSPKSADRPQDQQPIASKPMHLAIIPDSEPLCTAIHQA